jgi:DNA topoisomerase-2
MGVDKYKCTGTYNMISDDTLEITELPIRSWTQPYKEQIEAWVVGSDKNPALVKVCGD